MTTAERSTRKSRSQLADLDQLAAVLVPRVSNDRDGSKSVDDQVELMKQACVREGIRVLATYPERDVSGTRPLAKRPGLLRAVEDVEAGRAQVVVFAYFDRFVRSVKTKDEVLTRVEAAGGRVTTLDFGDVSNQSAMGWYTSTQNAAMTELYARLTAEKTHFAKQRAINEGRPPFPQLTPAYERREDGTLKLSKNAPIVKRACELRCEGKSYGELLTFLRANGIEMNSPKSVETMLRSKLLIGELHFGNFEPNLRSHEALITRSMHRTIESMRIPRGRKTKSVRLLARQQIVRCAACDAKLVVQSTRGNGRRFAYYGCRNAFCTSRASIGADALDAAVRDRAIELSSKIKGRASAKRELETARLEAEAAQQKLDETIEALIDLVTEPSTKRTLDALQLDRDEKRERHQRLLAIVTPDTTANSLDDWNTMTLDEQRALVRFTIDRVAVARSTSPRLGRARVVDLERVDIVAKLLA